MPARGDLAQLLLAARHEHHVVALGGGAQVGQRGHLLLADEPDQEQRRHDEQGPERNGLHEAQASPPFLVGGAQ